MNRIPNPFRGMRLSSILTIVACLSVCAFSVYQALDGQAFPTTATAVAAEASRVMLPADSLRTELADSGSPILTNAAASPRSQVKLTPIEDLIVGKRVQADSPTTELDLQFGSEVVSADWRKLTLLAPKRDGSSADVVLLRPLMWLNEQQAEVGGTVFISVPECGINGHANVLAIDPCPLIEPAGDLGGRVITGTFRHQVSASISLSIAGQAEPILCTGNHPFWSDDRHDFVRADSLQPDEKLRTTTGTTTVTSLRHIPGSTPVYNLEIHGTHVYHVGTSGVLVHNGGGLPVLGDCLIPTNVGEMAFGFSNNLPGFKRLFPNAKNYDDLGLDPLDPAFGRQLKSLMEAADEIKFDASGMRMLTGPQGVLTGPAHLNALGSTNWELRTIFESPALRAKTKIYVDGVLKSFDELLGL